MNLTVSLSVILFALIAYIVAKETSDACFRNGYSAECMALVRSRHDLTFEAFEGIRNRIKSLIDSERLHIAAPGISAFDMAMGCYAIGLRLPSERGCASCLNCEQQMSFDVCEVFCSLPPISPSSTSQTWTNFGPRDEKLFLSFSVSENIRTTIDQQTLKSKSIIISIVSFIIIIVFIFLVLFLVFVGVFLCCKKSLPDWRIVFCIGSVNERSAYTGVMQHTSESHAACVHSHAVSLYAPIRPNTDEPLHSGSSRGTSQYKTPLLFDTTRGTVGYKSPLLFDSTRGNEEHKANPKCNTDSVVIKEPQPPPDPTPLQSLIDTATTQSRSTESETNSAEVVIARPKPFRQVPEVQRLDSWMSLGSVENEPVSLGLSSHVEEVQVQNEANTQAQPVTPSPFVIYRPGPNEYDSLSGLFSMPPVPAPTVPPAPVPYLPAAPTHV